MFTSFLLTSSDCLPQPETRLMRVLWVKQNSKFVGLKTKTMSWKTLKMLSSAEGNCRVGWSAPFHIIHGDLIHCFYKNNDQRSFNQTLTIVSIYLFHITPNHKFASKSLFLNFHPFKKLLFFTVRLFESPIVWFFLFLLCFYGLFFFPFNSLTESFHTFVYFFLCLSRLFSPSVFPPPLFLPLHQIRVRSHPDNLYCTYSSHKYCLYFTLSRTPLSLSVCVCVCVCVRVCVWVPQVEFGLS